jgi:protocatechuate 3,4-dioxygenase beta subunit
MVAVCAVIATTLVTWGAAAAQTEAPPATRSRDAAIPDASAVGRVLDINGRPAGDVAVTVYRSTNAGRDREKIDGLTSRSDAEGRYAVRGLRRGERYELGFHKAGYLARSRSLTVPDQDVVQVPDYILPDGRDVSGRVQDEQGAPVSGAEVRFFSARTETDKDGRFLLKGLPLTREGVVYALKGGYAFGEERVPAQTEESSRAGQRGIVIILSAEHVVSGVVVDEAGAPVAGVEVSPFAVPCIETRTDAEGKFMLSKLPARKCVIVLRKKGFDPVESAGVPPGAADLRLVMKRARP